MATIRISGNWRNPSKMEWGGELPVDDEGSIERSLNIPERAYEVMEKAIAKGDVEGVLYLDQTVQIQWFLDR